MFPNKNRKIVFNTQVVNIAEVLQEGVTTYPDIAVMNLMKAKQGKFKCYRGSRGNLINSYNSKTRRNFNSTLKVNKPCICL